MEESIKIALFKGKKVRRIIYQNEWWFSVVNVVEVLANSTQPNKYWTAMKARVSGEDGIQLSTICRQLKLEASDGKKYSTDCANPEGILRIIQSIPSPKAEPLPCHAELASASLANASGYLKQVERSRNEFGMTLPQYQYLT